MRWLSFSLLLLLVRSYSFSQTALSMTSSTTQRDTLTLHVPCPTEGEDAMPVLLKVLEEAEKERSLSKKTVKIELERGEYTLFSSSMPKHTLYISNHDHVRQRSVALRFANVSDIVLEGNGSRLLSRGRAIPIVLENCQRICIRDLEIDNPHPALSQIEVLCTEADGTLKVRISTQTAFAIEMDSKLVLKGEGYEVRMLSAMPFSKNRHLRYGQTDLPFTPTEIQRTEDPYVLLIKGWKEARSASTGDVFVLRSWQRPTPGIVISDSKEISLKHVTVRYAEGMGLLAQHSADIDIDAFRVEADRKSGRFFTLQADGTHFSGCSGSIRSTNGYYEHMADDAINVHGTYLRIDSIKDSRTLYASFAHDQSFGFTWSSPGDSVAIVNRETLETCFKTVLLSDSYRNKADRKNKKIVLKDPLPTCILRGKGYVLENLTTYPTVLFCNNIITNNRARGALFSTRKEVLCEENTFDHTHGSAILLCGDANGWYESGPSGKVKIHRNRFVNALTGKYQFTNGIISIYPQIKRLKENVYYHHHVEITDNIFETFPSPLLYATSVQTIVWKRNKIIHNEEYPPLFQSVSSRLQHIGNYRSDI